MTDKPFKIAIAGLGTVGIGVLKILQQNSEIVNLKAGRKLQIVAISAKDKTKDRGLNLSRYKWFDDPLDFLKETNIDLVIELVGGHDGIAKKLIEYALRNKKHVVTANKALLAKHGHNLAILAERSSLSLKFEAAIAGGIPIVKSLSEGLNANQIKKIIGVLNGTCNYILTEMEKRNTSYETVFAEAQALGYVEADPKLDVGGIDAAQKLSILSAIAFGTKINFEAVDIEGIEEISLEDIINADLMGYKIKLLGIAELTKNNLSQEMKPCLVPCSSSISKIEGGNNMIIIDGNFVGQTTYEGPGAGAGPTASAVVADIIDVARNNMRPTFGQPIETLKHLNASTQKKVAYYLHFSLADKPGVLAKVAKVLGKYEVSIDRMRQPNHLGSNAPLVIITHKTDKEKLEYALTKIESLDTCLSKPKALQIEEI